MCKGAAILINDNEILMNKETTSHSSIRANEDNYLKINIIFDNTTEEGYRIEVDEHSKAQIEEYKKQCYLTKQGKIISSYLKRIKEYCKTHKGDIFKVLCNNMQSAKTGYVDFSSAKTGYVYFSSAKTGYVKFSFAKTGYVNFSFATTEDVDFRSATTEDVNFSFAKTGDVNFSFAKTGDVYFSSAKTGYVDFSLAKTGTVDFSSATAEDVDFRCAKIKQLFIKNLEVKDKKTTKLINQFSDSEQDNYTLTSFISWLIKERKGDKDAE